MYVHNISKPAPGPSLSGDDKGQLCVLWRRVNFDRSTVKHAPNSFSAGAPAGGAYSAPPDPLAGLREATCKGKGGRRDSLLTQIPGSALLLFCYYSVGRWTSLKTYSLQVLSAARKDNQELVHQDGTSMPSAAAAGKY